MRKLRLLQPQIHQTAKGPRLLDPVRKQLVPGGPEEVVRQSVLWSLVHDYGYPASALASEELVQRGTKNRDRADVLVRLPTSSARATFRVVSASEVPEQPPYSAIFKALEQRLDPYPPGVDPVALPDEMTVAVDGRLVRCRVLGFVIFEAEGHGLALQPTDADVRKLGLPPILGYLVSGHGRTEPEEKLATSAGIRQVDWTRQASLTFAHGILQNDGDVEARAAIELSALSADGRSGHMLMYGHDDDAYGVLVHLDLDAIPSETVAEDPPMSSFEAAPRGVEREVPAESIGELATIVVVECKAPGVPLTLEVTEQANRYASKLGAWFIVETNGHRSKVYKAEQGKNPVEIRDLPPFDEVCATKAVTLTTLARELPPPRLPAVVGSRPDCVRLHRRFRSGAIGQDSQAAIWQPILALDDALRGGDAVEGLPFERHGVRVVKDLGVNERNPGSAVGAGWPGRYRDMLIEARPGEQVVLGLSVLGAWEIVDRDRAVGHTMVSGSSYLIVALSDDAEYEAVLQFAFDKGLTRRGKTWQLRHDGRLTAGKGSVRREVLFDAVRERLPLLLTDDGVDLGHLPDDQAVGIDDLHEVLARIAVYALVRREVKRVVKAARRRGRPPT